MNLISSIRSTLAQLEALKNFTVYGLPNLFNQVTFFGGKIFIDIIKDICVPQNTVCKMLLNHHTARNSLHVAHAISDLNNSLFRKSPILKKIYQSTNKKEATEDNGDWWTISMT